MDSVPIKIKQGINRPENVNKLDEPISTLNFSFDIVTQDVQNVIISSDEMTLDMLCRLRIRISGNSLKLKLIQEDIENIHFAMNSP